MSKVEVAEAAATFAVPEAAVPLMAAQAIAPYSGHIFGGVLMALCIVMILVAIIIIAAAKTPRANRTGWIVFVVSLAGVAFGHHLTSKKVT